MLVMVAEELAVMVVGTEVVTPAGHHGGHHGHHGGHHHNAGERPDALLPPEGSSLSLQEPGSLGDVAAVLSCLGCAGLIALFFFIGYLINR